MPSPIPPEVTDGQILLTFPDAMREVISGKKVRRLEWENKEEYGILSEGYLRVYRDNIFYIWSVNDGDMYASDWIVVE